MSAAFAFVIGVGAVLPGTVHADPAEPTDYRSEVASVTPAVDGVDVEVVGGDAFLLLQVAPGHEVMVVGYQGEPFIRVLRDGRVEENRRSPSWALSQERLPAGDLPDDVGAELEPRWIQTALDGTWAWHDHRAHWMGSEPPMGLGPGDQVVDGVVPLVVDGRPVEVRVVSIWQQPPSPWPAWLGAGLGAAAAVLFVRQRRWAVLVGAVASVAALVVGTWEYASLPDVTGPRLTSWLLPAAALGACCVAAAARRRRPPARLAAVGALVVAAIELGLWAGRRRTVLSRAVLPTDAPAWFDRAVTAFVLVVAVGLAAAILVEVVRLAAPRRSAQRFDVVDDAGDLGLRQ